MENVNSKFEAMMEERLNRADTIAANLGVSTPLEKSISQTQFDDQYGVGYDVFPKENISKYINDLEKSVSEDEESIQHSAMSQASELIKGLTPVFVRDENKNVQTVFVRKSQEEVSEEQ